MKAKGLVTRGFCGCGNKAISAGLDRKGRQLYRTRCQTCINKARALRKDYCEACGIKWIEGTTRFDTDHIDGNPSNNDPKNVQTLCRPCHSKKTSLEIRMRRLQHA